MIIEISEHDLTDAAKRYHHNMVDQDQYTALMVRKALAEYVALTAAYFIENVTEFELERPDSLEDCLQATNQVKV